MTLPCCTKYKFIASIPKVISRKRLRTNGKTYKITYYSNLNRLRGGTRCVGSSLGKSKPSSFMPIRCIASANSSASSIPSWSKSDSFHTLPRMELGSRDFTSSVLATAPLIFPSTGPSLSNVSSYLYRSRATIQSSVWSPRRSTPSPFPIPNGLSL